MAFVRANAVMGRDGDIEVKGVELGGLRSGEVSYRRHTERPGEASVVLRRKGSLKLSTKDRLY